eukprot:2745065-Amphidinium_carterae.1
MVDTPFRIYTFCIVIVVRSKGVVALYVALCALGLLVVCKLWNELKGFCQTTSVGMPTWVAAGCVVRCRSLDRVGMSKTQAAEHRREVQAWQTRCFKSSALDLQQLFFGLQ